LILPRIVDNPPGVGYRLPMARRRTLLAGGLALAALLFLLAACSHKLTRQTKMTDAELYANGMQSLQKKAYGSAADHFQVLLEKYPASPLAPKAQLALADARMENGDEVEAEASFDDFLRLYPADDNVTYALYRKGELLSRSVADPGRDQTKTLEAIRCYQQVIQRTPDSPRASEAKARIRTLRDRLAAHEALVVKHYLKRQEFESAAVRAHRAAVEYPDSASAAELRSLEALAMDRQRKKEEAAAVRDGRTEKSPAPGGTKR
jgi:outer membrane protein assembly factor BamD